MDSILKSIKKVLGIDSEIDHFDTDIILHINAALATLTHMGVGPKEGFSITNESDTWDDFLGSESVSAFVKVYVYLKVKLTFDPPTSSALLESIKNQINEYEWRINEKADN